MEVYRRDILVVLDGSPDVGYVFGSYVKKVKKEDHKILESNERYIASLTRITDYELIKYSIIVRVANDGDYFDMPDTRLRINIDAMKRGHLQSEIRKYVSDSERPMTKVFSQTGQTVKLFVISAIAKTTVEGPSVFDNVFSNVTPDELRKIQNLQRQQKRVVRPKITSSTSTSDEASGNIVVSDNESAQLKTGVLYMNTNMKLKRSVSNYDMKDRIVEEEDAPKVSTEKKKTNAKKNDTDGLNWSKTMDEDGMEKTTVNDREEGFIEDKDYERELRMVTPKNVRKINSDGEIIKRVTSEKRKSAKNVKSVSKGAIPKTSINEITNSPDELDKVFRKMEKQKDEKIQIDRDDEGANAETDDGDDEVIDDRNYGSDSE